MHAKKINNIKLGVFVLAGLALLVFALYVIGKNSNFFGRNFVLKTRTSNAQGLMVGNNVRYAGIQAGTVKRIQLLNDSVVEITMLIDEKMKSFIHKNDMASIGAEGLVGNKLVNILPAKDGAAPVAEGDILPAKYVSDTGEMLETLDITNRNLVLISEDIRYTIRRINDSRAVWKILDDPALPDNLEASLAHIRDASRHADILMADLRTIVSGIKDGKGSLGAILTDTAIAYQLGNAITSIQQVGNKANQLADELSLLTGNVQQEINNGKGVATTLLKDSTLTGRLNNSLQNIEEGTVSFNQSMEALKHNFLLRGYFRKQEKQKKKEAATSK